MSIKKTKDKRKSLIVALFIVIAIILVATSLALLQTNNVAQSHAYDYLQNHEYVHNEIQVEPLTDTQLTIGWFAQQALLQRMQTDYFVYGGVTRHIRQFHTSLFGNRGALRVGGIPNIMQSDRDIRSTLLFNAPDPITAIIPLDVFSQLSNACGVFTLVGNEWGVIIDSFLDNFNIRHFIVQILDVNRSDNVQGLNPSNPLNQGGRFLVEIVPLFEIEFVWITAPIGVREQVRLHYQNPPTILHRADYYGSSWRIANFERRSNANLFALPWARPGLFFDAFFRPVEYLFTCVNRNYITNVEFTARLLNEQDANPAHDLYVPREDFGKFFHGTDMHFRAYDIRTRSARIRNISDEPLDIIDTIAVFGGFIPRIGNFFQFIDVLRWSYDMFGPAMVYAENHGSGKFDFGSSVWEDQFTEEREYLLKDNRVRFSKENRDSLGLLVGRDTFARGMFFCSQRSDMDGRLWISRIETGVTFDVRRHSNNIRIAENVIGVRSQILRDERSNYRQVSTNQPVRVYNHFNNTSRFRFVAPISDVFALSLNDNNHRIISAESGALNTTNYLNNGHYLVAGQAYYFHLEYLHNRASISYFTISSRFDSLLFFPIGTTGNAEVRLRPSGFHPSFIDIPATVIINGQSHNVTHIVANGFNNFTGTQIIIPSSVTYVGTNAFPNNIQWLWWHYNPLLDNSNFVHLITSVFLPNDMTRIRDNLFNGASGLIYIIIPQSVTSIGRNAFGGSGLQSITLPQGLTSIGAYAFAGNNFTRVTLPNSLETIGERAFAANNLLDINIPSSVSYIGDTAFAHNANLQAVTLTRHTNEGVVSFGYEVFFNTPNLRRIVVPSWDCVDVYRAILPSRLTSFVQTNMPQQTPNPALPTGLRIRYGQQLFTIALPVEFIWSNRYTVVTGEGYRSFRAFYTPTADRYYSIWVDIEIWVVPLPITPPYIRPELAALIGQTLWSVALPQGWEWTTQDVTLATVGRFGFNARFTHYNQERYYSIVRQLWIDVALRTPSYTLPTNLTIMTGYRLYNIELPSGWRWITPLNFVGSPGIRQHMAEFAPENRQRYHVVLRQLNVFVQALPLVVNMYMRMPYGTHSKSFDMHQNAEFNIFITFETNQWRYISYLAGNNVFMPWRLYDETGELVSYNIRWQQVSFRPRANREYRLTFYNNFTTAPSIRILFVSRLSIEHPNNYELPTELTATVGQFVREIALPNGWEWLQPNVLVGGAGYRQHEARLWSNNWWHFDVYRLLAIYVERTQYCVPTNPNLNIANGILFGYAGTGSTITIPYYVTHIVDRAFYRSNIEYVRFAPNSQLVHIGARAFYRAFYLRQIDLPNSLQVIGDRAFAHTVRLERLTIPAAVSYVGGWAFYNTPNLAITWHYNPALNSRNFRYALTTVVVPYGVTTIADRAFEGAFRLSSVTLSSTVEVIEGRAFQGTAVTNLALPQGLRRIEKWAFYKSNLAQITLPQGLEYIGARAFHSLNLTTITIPSSVTHVGAFAFYDTPNITLTISRLAPTHNWHYMWNQSGLPIVWVWS